MRFVLLAGLVLCWVVTTLLLLRVSSFRKDRRAQGVVAFLGPPHGTLGEILSPDSYVGAGLRLLRWLWVALAVLTALFFAALWLLV